MESRNVYNIFLIVVAHIFCKVTTVCAIMRCMNHQRVIKLIN